VIFKFFYKNYLTDIWKSKKNGTSIRIYRLLGGEDDVSKVVHSLCLRMEIRMNVYYGDWD